MEEKQDSAAETPKPDETPAIVEQAFGKKETAPTAGEPPAKAEGALLPWGNPAPPPNAAPPAPKSEGRENRRMQSLLSQMQQMKEKLAKYESGEQTALKPDEIAEKRFAELQLEQAQQQMQEENYKLLAEAFPDEAQRQEFTELAECYALPLTQYAPKAAELIAGSDISYKLEKAFYDICASDAAAFKDFLNMPYPAQRKALQGLEASLKNPAAPQTPAAPAPPANLPKSIDPSDSEASAGGKPDIFNSTLKRIADERNGK